MFRQRKYMTGIDGSVTIDIDSGETVEINHILLVRIVNERLSSLPVPCRWSAETHSAEIAGSRGTSDY